MRNLLIGGCLALSACAGAPVSLSPATENFVQAADGKVVAVTAAIHTACADARPLLPLAGLIPLIGGYVASGVEIACNTGDGLAKLAAEPSSAEWLGQQIQIMKNALGKK